MCLAEHSLGPFLWAPHNLLSEQRLALQHITADKPLDRTTLSTHNALKKCLKGATSQKSETLLSNIIQEAKKIIDDMLF